MNPSSYANLPERFFARVAPTPVTAPSLIKFNEELAGELAMAEIDAGGNTAANIYSGNVLPSGATPIAMAYAGHQFGQFVPQLGDGRAILLGECRGHGGVSLDVQLKGCGRTPYSRSGDGRAALGPVLREYIVSEAMHSLGIPTTRALAAVASGESVQRDEATPGAILTRVAASHVRVGTFEYFAARGDLAATRTLADYVIERHYPDAAHAKDPYLSLLSAVIARQAALVANWMLVGFVHGVMNTDNMAVSGETIDFGPCAFMDVYDPATVFSSIDRRGRYAYANQPHAAAWNLARFAETLLPLIDANPDRAVERAGEIVATFAASFAGYWLAGLRRKLGLSSVRDEDRELAESLLAVMYRNQADFTLTFRSLCEAAAGVEGDIPMRALFAGTREYDEWARRWRARLALEVTHPAARADAMRLANPAYIPRNHRVEQMIKAAVEGGEFGRFDELSTVLSQPYSNRPAFDSYAKPPLPSERVTQTFCGT
jgi:serine/tyrosine/threonine adenylyltransferase